MQEQWVKMATQMAEDAYEAMKKLNEVNVKTVQKVVEQQSAMMTDCLKSAQDGIEKLSAVKDYQQLAAAQNELFSACTEKMIGNYQNVVSLFNTAGEELGELVEANVKTAEANLKSAAKKAKKAA